MQGFMDRYDFSDMHFPATAMDLQIFQRHNENIAINALMFVKSGKSARVTPLYHPPLNVVRNRRVINIIYVDGHWMAVTNLNSLLSQPRVTDMDTTMPTATDVCRTCIIQSASRNI